MNELPFADERWVRIMCDYAADGVWHKDGAGDCADALPIPADLVARIRRWQDCYETSDTDEGFATPLSTSTPFRPRALPSREP